VFCVRYWLWLKVRFVTRRDCVLCEVLAVAEGMVCNCARLFSLLGTGWG